MEVKQLKEYQNMDKSRKREKRDQRRKQTDWIAIGKEAETHPSVAMFSSLF